MLVFGIAVFSFWAFGHRAVLSYQEQMQMFQTTSTYLWEHLSWPGGMATYIGEFLTQFYNNYWIGAAIISILLMLMYWATAQLCKQIVFTDKLYPFALGPVLIMMLYMGDINVMPSFIVAVFCALLSAVWFFSLKHYITQGIGVLIGLPVFYWLFGPTSLLLALLMSLKIFVSYPKHRVGAAVISVIIAAYAVVWIFIDSAMVNHPLDYQFVGINYYRVPTVCPVMEFIVEACFVAVVALSIYIERTSSYVSWGLLLVWGLICASNWSKFYDSKTLELIDYDYLVRTGKWEAIIKKAEKQQPDLPMSVAATNLALGMTGQLGDRAFQFYQNGVEGLLPPFQRESNSMWVTAEAYFQLGLVNTAQRFYFEGMEAIPNYRKSVRCIKRLAETNMINGQYEVAKKYLRMLENTTFYSKWAKRTEKLIADNAVDSHPLYGRMRHSHLQEDFLFSETERDKVLGQLFLKNPQNALAMQYLLVYPMLEKNMPKLMQYAQVVQEHVAYNPLLCQQGIALHAVQNQQSIPDGLVPAAVSDHLRRFAKTMTEQGKSSPALDQFRSTLWHYLLINE